MKRAALLLVLIACGGGAPKNVERPTVRNAFLTRSASAGPDSLYLGLAAVTRETPPAGWKPTTYETEEFRGSSIGLRSGRPTEQVFTAMVVDREDHAYGKIEHVDDSEPYYVVPEDRRTLRAYIPIVGPAGEPLTQIHLVHPVRESPDIAPVGKPIPRVTRWWNDRDPERPTFVFTLPVEGSTDLVQLIDEKGARIPLPEGVAGLVGVRKIIGPGFGHDWGGWLVRWDGAKGRGWSLSTDMRLAKLDTSGPRWMTPVERLDTFPKIVAIGGLREDGACEVMVTHLPNVEAHIPNALMQRTAPTCAEGAKAISDDVVAIVQKQMAAEKLVADRARAERDEQNKLAAQLEKQRKDRQAEDAKREAAERPTLAKWREELRSGSRDKACEYAKSLSPTSHATAYATQTTFDEGIDTGDYNCVTSRSDLSAKDRQIVENAYRRLYQERASRPKVQAPIGQGKLQDLGPKDPSAAERLKQTNDATYGSGRGSSCPYTDRSLCR